MKQDRNTYKAKQKRSEATRNKILDTAVKLFCKNGYYNVSTNEIARETDISIGNLYFYFSNKEEIFMQILQRYYQSFMQIHESFLKEIDTLGDNPKAFLKKLLDDIIKNHENSIELNREIRILSFSNPKVEDIVQKQKNELEKTVIHYFERYKEKIKVQDIEAAAEVIFIFLDSVIDQIAFSKNIIDKDRLLSESLNAVEAYILK